MYEYIKRTDAINEINRGDLLVGNNAEWAREIIWRTPYADVKEVKHGHWIEVKIPTGISAFGFKELTIDSLKCSICSGKINVSEGHYRFCPHCGAEMNGEHWYD